MPQAVVVNLDIFFRDEVKSNSSIGWIYLKVT